MTTPVEPRPASTVVVIRPADAGLEVLLVRRNDRVAFMAGAYVFPGGRVDAADRLTSTEPGFLREAARFPDLSTRDELPFRSAAVRELAEEAGVTVEADALLPIGHWVTPEIETRRYDTRFFLTVMPPGQEARHDEGETTALAWWTPTEALGRCLDHEIVLPPPTWTTLRQLERHASVSAAVAWARIVPLVRVQPRFLKEGTITVLTLPGDPSYPPMAGWVPPVETRFVLEEGRGWLPVRL